MEGKRRSVGNIIRIIVVIVLLCVVAYEAVMIYIDQKEYSVAINEYDSLVDQYVVEGSPKVSNEKEKEEPGKEAISAPALDIDFKALKAINPDIIGWMYFPALDITYPVVKETEIDEYIHKTFDGTYNKAGAIFMDVLSDETFNGYSDMIFGHNMKNGSMFGSLKRIYKEEGILDEDPHVYIYTESDTFIYRVFSYYTTEAGSYSYTEVTSENDYDNYISFIKRNSMVGIPLDIDFSEYPHLLTLSTCSGQTGSGRRFVVHTVREQGTVSARP